MWRRKDMMVSPDSIADVEELVTIALNQRELQEDSERVIKNKIEEITMVMKVVHDDFYSFLIKNNIDTNYPVFNDITTDDVVPSTVPNESMGAISTDMASLPNLPNNVMLRVKELLLEKYMTLQDEIGLYIDSLYKMKLEKASLEHKLETLQKVEDEYKVNIEKNRDIYNSLLSNLEKINSLNQNLLDFKSLFNVLPDVYTAYSYRKFQDNYFNRYSKAYYEKKKTIYRYSSNLLDTYESNTVDIEGGNLYTEIFLSIKSYFGSYGEEKLPLKYIDAIQVKDSIKDKITEFNSNLNILITNIKTNFNIIRGVKNNNLGNSVIEGLIASTVELSKSFVTDKTMEHSTLKTVSDKNYTVNLSVNENIAKIKRKLQLGVEKLDDAFIKVSGKFLRKISLTIGYPIFYTYSKDVNGEDHLRDIVRQKFGGDLPFCDEEKQVDNYGNVLFTKKTDLDPETGLRKMDVYTAILRRKTRNSRDVTSY